MRLRERDHEKDCRQKEKERGPVLPAPQEPDPPPPPKRGGASRMLVTIEGTGREPGRYKRKRKDRRRSRIGKEEELVALVLTRDLSQKEKALYSPRPDGNRSREKTVEGKNPSAIPQRPVLYLFREGGGRIGARATGERKSGFEKKKKSRLRRVQRVLARKKTSAEKISPTVRARSHARLF